MIASVSPALGGEPTGPINPFGIISTEVGLHSQTLPVAPAVNVFKESDEERHTSLVELSHLSSEACEARDSSPGQNQIPCGPRECAKLDYCSSVGNIQLNDNYGVDQMAKLDRMNLLLSQAARLHEEIFG